MRTIEEIKADIEKFNKCDRKSNHCPKDICKIQSNECDRIHERRTNELQIELLQALTETIPLDRLEQICNAERDGRLVVLQDGWCASVVPSEDTCGMALINITGECTFESAEQALKGGAE